MLFVDFFSEIFKVKISSERGKIYIYAFSRRFYPKRLTVHSGYTFFYQYVTLVFVRFTAVNKWNIQWVALKDYCFIALENNVPTTLNPTLNLTDVVNKTMLF